MNGWTAEYVGLTIAKAMPTKTPILLTAEYHMGPKLPSEAELVLILSWFDALGPLVDRWVARPPFIVGDTVVSQKESTTGSAFPSRMPNTPQEIW
jgi:hypothetical protein